MRTKGTDKVEVGYEDERKGKEEQVDTTVGRGMVAMFKIKLKLLQLSTFPGIQS